MAGGKASGKFVHKKINKIRWKPRTDTSYLGGKLFVTGSWDDLDSNEISLWEVASDPSEAPKHLSKFKHSGDVHEITFLNPEVFCAASSDGSVNVLHLAHDNSTGWQLGGRFSWPKLHSAACNSVAAYGERLVSVGEDGQIFVMNAKNKNYQSRLDNQDNCSLNAACFVKHDEIVVGNNRGQLKLWDLRTQELESSFFLSSAGDQVAVTCIAKHPTQPHVLCTGSEDGLLAIWDLRNVQKHPVTLLKGHSQAVSEVHFHGQNPDHIFSCSLAGDVLHWNGSAITRAHNLNFGNQVSSPNPSAMSTISPWLSSEAVKHRVETHSLMSKQPLPINSIDPLGSALLVAGDNEAIYVIPSVIL